MFPLGVSTETPGPEQDFFLLLSSHFYSQSYDIGKMNVKYGSESEVQVGEGNSMFDVNRRLFWPQMKMQHFDLPSFFDRPRR